MKKTESTIQTGSVEVPLTRPLDIDGAKVSVLTMREPLVEDQLAVQNSGGPADQELALIANLCMVTPADLRKMPLRDYMKVKAVFVGFID